MDSTTEKAAKLSILIQNANGDPRTSAYCSARALNLLQAAVRMPGGVERTELERGAAGWSMRAEQLSRSEARLAQPLPGACTDLCDAANDGPAGNNRGLV